MKHGMTLTDHDMMDDLTMAQCKKRRKDYLELATDAHDFDGFPITNPLYQEKPFMMAPDFNCSATVDARLLSKYHLTHMEVGHSRCQLSSMLQHAKAVVLFFYGRDFTTITNSDLASISFNMDRFERYSALPLAISIDSEEVHQSYLQHKWEQSREVLPFPLLSDPTRSITRHFNVLNTNTGAANRAVFIIDQARQIQFSFILGDDRIAHSMDTLMTMPLLPINLSLTMDDMGSTLAQND